MARNDRSRAFKGGRLGDINIPLHIVAPDDRRDKVIIEMNRPTFSKLSPPMSEMCRFISFATLRERLSQVASVVRHLKPEFLEEISESCEAGEPYRRQFQIRALPPRSGSETQRAPGAV